ncbi:CCA tRNA nucleotidyltransferase [Fusobacterium varium]|uniref:CCA tRNA nucleotidyltransferase n=1 Tax=Fusobacterium varium TaxID=856 RepID=UPI000E4088D6|nr:CCA tRNA nucleotidyltransferase [Fusobacterium varium]MCI6032149.1 CCA tRNA nucleotidyltransferase [Fusobacterium varium]RGJ30122.1 CCA tRNA nucleotidyltransferase [Fusobacterium varium]
MEKLKKIELGKNEKYILETIQKYGEGYIVGGYVRDSLLGLKPKDCDFVTNLSYEKLLEIFKEFHPKEIGKAFGIIQIKYKGTHYEIAKYRKDIGVPEDRREQEVEFTDNIMEDLKRRDFTINAVAFDGENYRYVEHAVEDIMNKNLRFVGEAPERIKEDPLRVMRFIRFLVTKNLNNKNDIEQILPYIPLVKKLSMERMRDEFSKIITADDAHSAIELLEKTGILEYLIPEWTKTKKFNQRNPHHNLTLDEHIKKVVASIEGDIELRLAALLHDIGKPQTYTLKNGIGHFYGHEQESAVLAEKILLRMKYANKIVKNVTLLIANHLNNSKNSNKKYCKKLIEKIGYENMPKLFKLMEADRIAHKPPFDFTALDKLKIAYYEICNNNEPISIKDLVVNGNDMIALGITKGKDIGETLKYLLGKVLEDSANNDRKILLNFAEQYKIILKS